MAVLLNPGFSWTASCSNRESIPYVQFLQVLIQHRCLIFHCFKFFFPHGHIFLFLAFYGISSIIFPFFFSVALSHRLIHCFFQVTLNFSITCLSRVFDKTEITTWGSLDIWIHMVLPQVGIWRCLEVPSSFTFLTFPLSFFPWPCCILFFHRWHDPKFSKALRYKSTFLSRKTIRNKLGSHWNDFPRT